MQGAKQNTPPSHVVSFICSYRHSIILFLMRSNCSVERPSQWEKLAIEIVQRLAYRSSRHDFSVDSHSSSSSSSRQQQQQAAAAAAAAV